MRKSGFTLIELIFVIVIIGVLAATAIPKFKDLKQSAEGNNVVKTTTDAASGAVSAAVNLQDLDENTTFDLEDIVTVTGRGWSQTDAGSNDMTGTYTYKDPTNGNTVALVALDGTNRTVTYGVDCNQFNDTRTKEKCGKVNDVNSTARTLTY